MKQKITILITIFFVNIIISQNIANGKTTAASSGDNHALAVDGNLGTRWESDHSDPQWWSVDLGASYTIGNIIIKWEASYGSEYKIQISNDNMNWTDIYTENAGDGGTDDLSVNATGQYIRYYGTARGLPYGHSFWEFEVYEAIPASQDASLSNLTVNGTTVSGFSSQIYEYDVTLSPGSTEVPTVIATTSQASPAVANITNATSLPGTTTILVTAQDATTQQTYTINFSVEKENLAANKTATASSEVQSAAFAFDENTGTRWESDQTDSEWVYIDLETANNINGVQLNWEGAYGSEYTIDVSNDAINWNTVYTEDSGDGGIDDITFTTTSARYVRMNGTTRGTIYGYSLWEFEVYGDAPLNVENYIKYNTLIYPNPTTNFVHFKSDFNIETLTIFDVLGKKIYEDNTSTTTKKVSLGNFKRGIYLAKIRIEGEEYSKKIMKK